MFRRRTLLLSAALLPLSAAALLPLGQTARAAPAVAPGVALSPQDKADIARIEDYLNSLKSLKARFTQVAADGGVTQGTAWLERPGRMRFQYDPPAPFVLIAAHGQLIFHDSSLGQTSNIPLARTPLGILLADRVELAGAVTVTGMQHLPGQIHLTLVRTASPGDGSLTLIFADPPLTLRQWTVVDAQRRETHVTLYNAQTGGSFDPQLFEQIIVPANKPG
jgi:outer membrane lipoprotein-sorting protein